MLAGLYLSTRGMVNVEGADSVTYYGTTQDDVIDMTVRNVADSVKVDTGKGDDRVDVRVEKRPNLEFRHRNWKRAGRRRLRASPASPASKSFPRASTK